MTSAPMHEQPVTDADLPQTFGPYLLVERIGSGGMADVFHAVVFGSEGFRRRLVVKRIRAELCGSREFVRMFTDEARITALLDHPNIVQVLDFGQVDGRYYLAMEHLDGKDLAAVMRVLRPAGLALRPSLVGQISLQIALGLHHAHTLTDHEGRPCKIVHRDINPANVMLVRTGGVKVLDFGIAKASAIVGKAQTQYTKLKGKLGYLSPEQAKGQPLDGRSDLFSLGITMWEMLTGHRLFAAKTDYERIRKVLNAPIEPPSALRPSVPRALDAIVMRALERDRGRRYASGQEMAEEIEAFLATRQTKGDGVRQLLSELFGNEPSVSTERPTFDPAAPVSSLGSSTSGRIRRTGSGVAPVTATHSLGSGPLFSGQGVGDRATASGAPLEQPTAPRPRVLSWVAGAALLVAGAGAFSGLLRDGARSRSLQVPVVPLPTLATDTGGGPAAPADEGVPAGPTVQVDIQSEPSGAAVIERGRMLGNTPLTVALPRSSEMAHLRFALNGFTQQTYDLRPETDGLVFVELQRARRAEAPAPRQAIRKAPRARR